MILPDFVLLSRVGVTEKFTGIDSEEFCQNPRLFGQYPHEILYQYNRRGFRDAEWPEDLNNAIWCFGDSFTVGLGSPQHHAWPAVLQRRTHTRCINVSLDGASNQWISRKITSLAHTLNPHYVVVHWSYIHRRESSESLLAKTMNHQWQEFYNNIKDPTWPDCAAVTEFDKLPEFIKQEIHLIHAGPREHALLEHCAQRDQCSDEDRRLYFDSTCDELADIEDTIDCIGRVNKLGINIVHSFIPEFAAESAARKIIEYLDQQQCSYIAPFVKLDRARDGHHYDIITSEFLSNQIIPLI